MLREIRRKEESGTKLTPDKAPIDRSNEAYNLEKGLSATVGFDLKSKMKIKILNFL